MANVPVELLREIRSAARDLARRGLSGAPGDPLPELMSGAAVEWIGDSPETFKALVASYKAAAVPLSKREQLMLAVLKRAIAYVGKGCAEHAYDGCVVSGERALGQLEAFVREVEAGGLFNGVRAEPAVPDFGPLFDEGLPDNRDRGYHVEDVLGEVGR